jgi:exosortase A
MALAALSLGCFIYSYHGTFFWLYERYTNPDSHYSHGFLIPFISGYLIWKKREQLKSIPASSSITGLALMALALLIHIGSIWTHTFFTSGFSILLLFVGFCLYVYGVEFTKTISFPLAYLLFMFPLPMAAISAFSFPLKLLVAKLGEKSMQMVGIDLYKEGAIIHLTNTSLTIGDPCSGIRSIISLLALGALMAYLSKISVKKKIILFLSAIPIAIVTNVLRVCALILIANFMGGEWASPEHWFHMASGMGVFVVSMLLLLLGLRVLE